MAISKFRGIVKDVLPIETYGEASNQGKKQTVVIFVPGYTDPLTQEKKGPDEEWGVDIFNNQIEKFNLNVNSIDKIVDVEINLRGRSYDRTAGGKGYSINATLKDIKIGNAANTSFKESASVGEDDLPF